MSKKWIWQAVFITALGIFAGSLFMVGMIALQAQPLPTDGNPPPPRLEELVKALNLSSQQMVTFRNALDAERGAMDALNESIQPQRDVIVKGTREKLSGVLSVEQMNQYEEWKRADRPPRREYRDLRHGRDIRDSQNIYKKAPSERNPRNQSNDPNKQ